VQHGLLMHTRFEGIGHAAGTMAGEWKDRILNLIYILRKRGPIKIEQNFT
jgi:hypothetical protein